MRHTSTGRHPVTGASAPQEADIVRAALTMVLRKKRAQRAQRADSDVHGSGALSSADATDVVEKLGRLQGVAANREQPRPVRPYHFEDLPTGSDLPQVLMGEPEVSQDSPSNGRAGRSRSSPANHARVTKRQLPARSRTSRSRLEGAQQHRHSHGAAPATHWEHTRAAFGDGLRSFRRFALFLTTIALVLMVAIYVGRQIIHEQIRKTLVQRLNEHYSDAGVRIEIGAVRFQERSGFHISGVRVVNLDSSSRDTSNDVLVSIERVRIHAETSIWDLIRNDITAKLIEIDGVRAYAHRDALGEWNVAKLFPLPKLSERPAPIHLTNGQVVVEAEGTSQLRKPLRVALADLRIDTQWEEVLEASASDASRNDAPPSAKISPVSFQQQQLKIPAWDQTSAKHLSQTFELPDDRSTLKSRKSDLDAEPDPRSAANKQDEASLETMASKRLKFRVSFATERIARAEFEGLVDFKLGTWQVAVHGERVVLDDEYLELVPPEVSADLATLKSFDGELNVRGTAQGTFPMNALPTFHFEGDVQKGRVNDSRLPYPLDNVEARFAVDNSSFQLWDVTAQFGTGRVAVQCEGGWLGSGTEPLAIHISGQKIRLDDSISDSLPDSLRKIWFDYSPIGLVNFDLRLTHLDGVWQPDLTMQLIDLSFEPRAFPYRVDGCHGVITWKDDVCTVDCKGLASGRMATFKGTIYKDPLQPTQIDVDLPRPIPIDEKLFQALEVKPKLQSTIRAFHPTGMMTCHATLRRSPVNSKIRLDALEVFASDGSIQYDKVPYPVNGISGRIVYQNGIVSFQEFRGQNDGGTILLEGIFDSVGRLELKLTGSAIQMEEELRLAMPIGLQQLWLNLRPRGAIDHVQLRVVRNPNEQMSFEVQAVKHKQHRGLTQSLSIQPVWFPQRLNDVTGIFDYQDGQVRIREFEAYAGAALVSTEGIGEVTPHGWKTTFENLSVDALVMDEPFLQAMPQTLASALRKLELQGSINVFGKLVLSTGEQRTLPIDAGLGQVWGQDRDERRLPLGGLELPGEASTARDLVVDWDLRLDMDGGSMKLSKKVEHIFGGVRLIGRQDESGTHQVGYVDVDSLVVQDVQLTQVRGPIRIEPSFVAIGRRAELARLGTAPQPLRAELFDGQLHVDAHMTLDDRGDFGVHAFFENGDLSRVAAELAPRLSNIRGLANGSLELTGNSLGPESYSGRGYLRLRNAQIYEIPLVLSLLKVLSIKQPDKTAFTECNFDFTIADEHFTFDPIELKGDAISLKGNGEIAFDRELNMMFYAMVGRDDVKIPVISRLAGAASQNAWQVEVDGTLQEPVLKQHPFPVLNDTLQQIFPETISDPAYQRSPRTFDPNRPTTRRPSELNR